MATIKRARQKKAAKKCECLKAMQAEAVSRGFEFETAMMVNFRTGESRDVGPLLLIKRSPDAPKKRRKMPTVVCAYCPFCGKKQPV